ncbi:uncharacterized protein LOC120768909 [Bactrocera tryoni]|uniref:uncharacterized protein LOC120768909 n=1 Tax=Bactrocera tryoni TaxID=59916 RepID=UPI001A967FA2|nr:uncharacterized protein LOC120768909 [Bactrocera tryoni]XP_039951610.1 uncharacterized protein LOC120768909 [Bactrocera tryoni]
MPLAVVSMLQQQKCLETLDEQQQQKNQATAVAEVGSTQRQYAETRLINAAFDATCKQEQRTAWQHVTATKQQPQQQVSSEKSLRDTTNLHNVGITDKCMLNAAARQQTHVASNITHTTNRNVATLVEHTEANVALEKVLNKSKQQTETLHVANSIGNKVLSNMLPQHTTLARLKTKRARHQSVAAVQSAEKRAKIANAKAKATKLNTTTIITTTTNQSTQSAAMCEIAAPTGEPSVKQQRQHQHHNTEKTIDFNSRRRRGRLRAANMHNAVCGNGLTASVCRALMWLARYLEKVAHNRASAGYDQSDPLLYLLSVLLSLIVVNVNRVASLVNEYKCEVNSNALANTNNKVNTNNTTNTPNTNSAKNNKNLQIITNQTIELVSESTEDAGSGAELLQLPEIGDVNEEVEEDKISVDALESESESEQVAKAKNNNKINAQNTVMTLDRNALALTERAGLMTARSATKRGKSNCAANAHASATTKPTAGGTSKTFVAMQMQLLFYAFILCTSILLPSGNNLVAAAKPKSATQLQQQKLLQQQQLLLQQQQQQQQQYEHQHGHQAHQPAAGPNGGFGTLGGYASAGIPVASGGTAGADLTPPTYQVVSSRASNEQAEFIFPADQSDEQVFDQENLNVVELDDDDDDEEEAGLKKTYGLHDNGKSV